MKLEFRNNCLSVIREDSDPKYYGVINGAGESKLLSEENIRTLHY